MQAKSLLEIINGILASKHKMTILTWLFSGTIIIYLHDNNASLQNKLDLINATNQTLVIKLNDNCEEQLKNNRISFQRQLDTFIDKSNNRRDSTENYFYNELRKATQKINEKIITIK